MRALGTGPVQGSGRLRIGPEIWVDANVSFQGESSRISPGVYRIFSSAGVLSGINVPNTAFIGGLYRYAFTIDSVTAAGSGLRIGGGGAADGLLIAAPVPGTFSFDVADTDTLAVMLKRQAGITDIQVSAISVKQLYYGP